VNQPPGQTIQVIQRNEGCFSGCGTFLAIALLIGLAVAYWYVAVPVAIVLAGVGLWYWNDRRKRLPAARQGALDPWLNRIAMRLAQDGYSEQTRNTGQNLGGQPLEGDLVVEGNNMRLFVNILSDDYSAGQAANNMRAGRRVQDAMTSGHSAIVSQGRVVLVANPVEGTLKPDAVEHVLEVASRVTPPPDVEGEGRQIQTAPSPPPKEQADLLEQLRKLGELRDQGVVTQEEFDAKKAELLDRL
jgi:hypothetical protein